MEVNYKNITHLHGLYSCGMSLAKVSDNYCPSISRQRLHYYFKMYRLPLRTKRIKESRMYAGEKYSQDNEGYWRKTSGNREFLQRRIWIDAGNSIPEGFAVIFKDRNRNNVEIDNLDCVSLLEFGEIYSTGENQFTKNKGN